MWKSLLLVLGLIAAPLAAQAPLEVRGLGRAWTELGLPVAGHLRLDLEAGGVKILPSEDGKVRVRFTGRGDQDVSQVTLRFTPGGSEAELRLAHTPNNNFQIEIQIPKLIALTLRMSAGELEIQGIEGDKDLRLQAGELTVHVGSGESYGPVQASVWAGEINPGPFGEAKGGLFRSFSREGKGKFALLAKVKSGEIRFQK